MGRGDAAAPLTTMPCRCCCTALLLAGRVLATYTAAAHFPCKATHHPTPLLLLLHHLAPLLLLHKKHATLPPPPPLLPLAGIMMGGHGHSAVHGMPVGYMGGGYKQKRKGWKGNKGFKGGWKRKGGFKGGWKMKGGFKGRKGWK